MPNINYAFKRLYTFFIVINNRHPCLINRI